MQKQGVWILWIGSLAAMLLGGGSVATVGRWTFGLLVVVHLVEFVVNLPLFRRAGGSLAHHFLQTLIYGFFHWKPIKERLDAQTPG